MIDHTHFRIPASPNDQPELPTAGLKTPKSGAAGAGKPDERLNDVEKRLVLFEELLFDCAMTLKDKVAERLDKLEDLCHHETAQLRQEWQENNHDRKKELNQLTLKISEAIDRIAAEKALESKSASGRSGQPTVPPETSGDRLSGWDNSHPGKQAGEN
jgi:hypothetical protein